MSVQNITAGDDRIVVGVDGSESSKAALRLAAQLAAPNHAVIEAVTAWPYPRAREDADGVPHAGAPQILELAVADVFGDERPDNLRLVVSGGRPAQVLLEQSRGAAMVIVGSRGQGGGAGRLLGSVSTAVAEHATCSVLVIHAARPTHVSVNTDDEATSVPPTAVNQ